MALGYGYGHFWISTKANGKKQMAWNLKSFTKSKAITNGYSC